MEETNPETAPVPEADVTPQDSGSTATAPAVENPNAATAAYSGDEYIIQAGDSLGKITRAAGHLGRQITIKQIIEANPGLDPRAMRVGQKIIIPDPGASNP